MADQERRSRTYWDNLAAQSPGASHCGLLSRDEQLVRYRDVAEKAVLLARHAGRLRLSEGPRVLEVGCGGGRWTTWLARLGATVVASDISERMIDHTRRKLVEDGVGGVELYVAAMHELPDLGAFDIVYLGSCLHYMSDEAIDAGLPKVAGMLRRDGCLLTRDTVSLIGRTFHRSERYGGDDPAIYRPLAYYEERFERCNLRLTDAWPTHVTPLAWRIRRLLPRRSLAALLEAEVKWAAGEVRLAPVLRRPGDKEHRFYLYEPRGETSC